MEDFPRPGLSYSVAEMLSVYGWYLLIVAVLLVYLYKKAEPTIDKYFSKKAENEYSAKYHKDPDTVLSRLATQQAVIEKLQAKYNSDAVEYDEKLQQKESKKRDDWLNKQNNTDGHRLGSGPSKSLKQDYNPLMGDTSPSYRPEKKSKCSGGGCGR